MRGKRVKNRTLPASPKATGQNASGGPLGPPGAFSRGLSEECREEERLAELDALAWRPAILELYFGFRRDAERAARYAIGLFPGLQAWNLVSSNRRAEGREPGSSSSTASIESRDFRAKGATRGAARRARRRR